MTRRHEDLIVGLDIGTTKICAIVGEVTDDGVDIVGIGSTRSTGLRKGVVINIESTIQSIRKAIEEAELMAGCEITGVYAGIAGSHIRAFNSHGVVAVKDKEVNDEDVRRVIDAAQAIAIPTDQELIHVIPQEYIIDDQDGIKEPRGMAGVRLEAKVHIITASVSAVQNIVKCATRAGLQVRDIVLEPLASAEACLSADEKELGVALVDIGGGTADLSMFLGGSVVHSAVIPLGGDHFTNDIAVGLRTPVAEAEQIKHRYGCALGSLVGKDETIEVPSVGGRPPRVVSRRVLTDIIEPRAEEILTLVDREIAKSGFGDLIASGVVLTGGTTIMAGMVEAAERIFDLPVRRASPQGIGGLTDVVNSPMYATGVGLVLYGVKAQGVQRLLTRRMGGGTGRFGIRIKDRIRQMFGELF
ncbi:MAG TPA: cell division protein FtsA [bacterium]|nr:cell division protein FtsA [bacterium]